MNLLASKRKRGDLLGNKNVAGMEEWSQAWRLLKQ